MKTISKSRKSCNLIIRSNSPYKYLLVCFCVTAILMVILNYIIYIPRCSIQVLEYKKIKKFNINKSENEAENPIEAICHIKKSRTIAQEMFNYLSVELNKTNKFNKTELHKIVENLSDIKNVLDSELRKVEKFQNLDDFKMVRLKSIAENIRSRINNLQNLSKIECLKSKKLYCRISWGAGFASVIHEMLWCFIFSYHSNKTLILSSERNYYFKTSSGRLDEGKELWNDILKPIGSECDSENFSDKLIDNVPMDNTVIARKIVNFLPKEFGSELMKLVESSNSWFHSQFIGYILRPQKRLTEYLENYKKKLNYKHPIVGVHVRRTDKVGVGEALYHGIDEYMIYVKDYYNKLELNSKIVRKLVYVASDDPTVLSEFIKKYPEYEFIGSTSISEIASNQSTRYTNSSLWGVLTDINLLAESDYIVCTFSSAICRLSYQLMRYIKGDESFSYRSLDVPFHYHHSLTPVRKAVYNHKSRSKNVWDLKVDDRVYEPIGRNTRTEWFKQAVNGRGWDSFFYASNTTSFGNKFYKLYPYYKVEDEINLI